MPYLIICILFSFIIGFLGRNRKMGFWGYFFATFVLTPPVGILLIIVSDKRKRPEDEIHTVNQ